MLFLKRQDREKVRGEKVQRGAVYKRKRGYNVVELAEVLWIGPDAAGIPHVRFQISYLGPDFAEEQSTRMLALASFAALYGPQGEGATGALSPA